MQITIWLINVLKSGGAILSADGMETLRLEASNRRIDLNLMRKEFLKDMLEATEAKESSLVKKLAFLKGIAEELKNEGLTVTISYKGSKLFTLGSGARPTLSQVVTGTDAIEINDPSRLIQVVI